MSKPLSRINQVLPVEMLSTIFSFINPSLENPYPHLPLSLVCRHWRQVVVNNPQFWSILEYKETETEYKYFREQIIHRSKSHKLCIRVSEDSELSESQSLKNYIASKSSCVTFLSFDYFYVDTIDLLSWLDFPFPQLENLFISHLDGEGLEEEKNLQYLGKLITGTRLRRLDVSLNMLLRLDRLGLIHHLSSIEWLRLDIVRYQFNIPRVLEILHAEFPNLQILNILSDRSEHLGSVETITLPKVRILTLNNFNVISPIFDIPNLDYFCITSCHPHALQTWPQFGAIDFSRIRHIRVGLHRRMTEVAERYFNINEEYIIRDACITGMMDSSVDCASFQDFHENGMMSQALATQGSLDLPPKNTFHLVIPWLARPKNIFVLLQQTTNLTELTLDHGSLKGNAEYNSLLANIMHSTQTIVRLNIMHARGFVEACHPLTQGDTAPCLEQLTYHNSFLVKSTSFLPRRVRIIQKARVEASSQPLKVLEVRNFFTLPNGRASEFEEMGIQFIQS